jgi:hypothetical protein
LQEGSAFPVELAQDEASASSGDVVGSRALAQAAEVESDKGLVADGGLGQDMLGDSDAASAGVAALVLPKQLAQVAGWALGVALAVVIQEVEFLWAAGFLATEELVAAGLVPATEELVAVGLVPV